MYGYFISGTIGMQAVFHLKCRDEDGKNLNLISRYSLNAISINKTGIAIQVVLLGNHIV